MNSRELVILDRRSIAMTESPVDPFFSSNLQLGEVGLRIDGPNASFAIKPSQRPCILVGRSTDCDVILNHGEVSYRHAYFQLCGGHLYCVDLDSRTGTRWGGICRPSAWIRHRETISIGPYSITAESPKGNSQSNPPPTDDLMAPDGLRDLRARPAELSFLNSVHAHRGDRRWKINQPLTLIGSSAKCRLKLNHDSISAMHCSLFATSAGLWAIDLLGRDGISVNGERVRFHLLQQGDELRVGRFQFGVDYPDSYDELDPLNADDEEFSNHLPHQPATPNQPNQAAGISESFMLSLVDRFAAMQQQMATMNHQQMAMMTQMLSTMQGNYNDLVQKELAKIQQLSSQIEVLQDQVERAEADQRIEASPASNAAADSDSDVRAIDEPRRIPEAKPEESPAETRPDVERRRVTQGDIESHTLLIERMSSLERERSSRWKRLMKMIAGSSH